MGHIESFAKHGNVYSHLHIIKWPLHFRAAFLKAALTIDLIHIKSYGYTWHGLLIVWYKITYVSNNFIWIGCTISQRFFGRVCVYFDEEQLLWIYLNACYIFYRTILAYTVIIRLNIMRLTKKRVPKQYPWGTVV